MFTDVLCMTMYVNKPRHLRSSYFYIVSVAHKVLWFFLSVENKLFCSMQTVLLCLAFVYFGQHSLSHILSQTSVDLIDLLLMWFCHFPWMFETTKYHISCNKTRNTQHIQNTQYFSTWSWECFQNGLVFQTNLVLPLLAKCNAAHPWNYKSW